MAATSQYESVETYMPAPREFPWCYPGRIPGVSFAYDGNVYLFGEEDAWPSVDAWLAKRGSPCLAERIPVVCSGSNACPAQIASKWKSHRGDTCTPFLLAQVEQVQAVYAAMVAAYGAIPATLDFSEGNSTLHVGFYTPEQLESLNATEAPEYALAVLDVGASLSRKRSLPLVYAFMSLTGVLASEAGLPLPLQSLAQVPLLEWLLHRIGHRAGIVRAEEYLNAPAKYVGGLCRAIETSGVAQPARLRFRSVSVSEAQPVAVVQAL